MLVPNAVPKLAAPAELCDEVDVIIVFVCLFERCHVQRPSEPADCIEFSLDGRLMIRFLERGCLGIL